MSKNHPKSCLLKENHLTDYKNNEIDLRIEDLPHESSNSEWWYFNFHFEIEKTKEKFSLFFCFFRIKTDEKQTDPHYFIIYLLIDHQKKRHQAWSIWDTRLPIEASQQIKKRNKKNNDLLKYLAQILEKGEVVAPDLLCKIDFKVNKENIYAKFGDSEFSKKNDLYYINIKNDSLSLQFTVTMDQPIVRHGTNGFTLLNGSPDDESMFYYFMPKGKVTGLFNQEPISGTAWYDHEFSIKETSTDYEKDKKGWLWFSIQLENNIQLSIYQIFDRKTLDLIEQIAKFIDEKGKYYTTSNFSLKKTDFWQSSRTLTNYPVQWKISLDELNCELLINPLIKEQEVVTLLGNFAFYEGVVTIECFLNNKKFKGFGFVEQYGLNEEIMLNSDNIVNAASTLTLNQINNYNLPEKITNPGKHFIKDPFLVKYINTIPYEKIYEAGVHPLRDMLLRRGKAWRSFFCMVCINAVGGNSEDFREWTAIAEIIQSSSLIIDDIQDHSEVRRGKETIHTLYGTDKAINAGLLGYFIFNNLMKHEKLSSEQLVNIYNIYFDTAIASITGQCADIAGMQDILLRAIDTGDNQELLKTIDAMHTLKTGVAAKSLAQIGVILGNGSLEQRDKIGYYALQIGLGFQYIDDLRAYSGDQRALEEDVMSGKITLPIAIAIPRLTPKQRKWLGEIIFGKKRSDLQALVNLFNEMGVIDDCIKEAKSIVAQAWKKTEPVLSNSIYKALLYYIGIFALEIHMKQKQ